MDEDKKNAFQGEGKEYETCDQDYNEETSFYAIIPATIRYCRELEPAAKLFYAELTALAKKKGYCWASNEYLAQLQEVDTRTIRRWLESLKKQKFIAVEVVKEGIQTRRRIWIDPRLQKMFTNGRKCPPGWTNMSTPPKASPYYILTKKEEYTPASRLALFFFQELQKIHPEIKANLKTWAKQLDLIMRIDGRSEDKLRKVILYVVGTREKFSKDGFSWSKIILSPSNLRKNFDRLWAEMGGDSPKDDRSTTGSQTLAKAIVKKFPNHPQINLGSHKGKEYIEFIDGPHNNIIYYDDADFKNKVMKELTKRKLNL